MEKIKKTYKVFKKYELINRILTIIGFGFIFMFAISSNKGRPYEDTTIIILLGAASSVIINFLQIIYFFYKHGDLVKKDLAE